MRATWIGLALCLLSLVAAQDELQKPVEYQTPLELALGTSSTFSVNGVQVESYSSLVPDAKLLLFAEFVHLYNRYYSTLEEFEDRFHIFEQSLVEIDRLNSANFTGSSSVHRYGISKFADLTPAEFKAMHLRPLSPVFAPAHPPNTRLMEIAGPSTTNSSIDWRNQTGKYLLGVSNQGVLQASGLISAVENMASVSAIAGRGLVDGSVQQIVDCDNAESCGAGDPPVAYEYVVKAGGLESTASYPNSNTCNNCSVDPSKYQIRVSGWKFVVPPNAVAAPADETSVSASEASNNNVQIMVEALAKNPLSVCVDASSWQFYTGGVITSNCGQQIDHCALLVGYINTNNDHGADASSSYWIVQNSWGVEWGMDGFAYVSTDQNLCAMQDYVTTAVA